MSNSPFDPARQNANLTAKITSGLERIASVFRVLLWQHAKTLGLSPIQIQLMIFIAHHDDVLCSVTHLAQEFNLTKPTISEALKVLLQKKLIKKVPSELDRRAFTVKLTAQGMEAVDHTELFANPVESSVDKLSKRDKEQLFFSIKQLIYGLNRANIIAVQRTCFGCRFYERKSNSHFCHLLSKKLLNHELRIDCPEFDER